MAVGKKTGGRVKGVPNKRTATAKAEMKAAGEMPLEYALRIMRDPTIDNERRDWACGQAMRFCHSPPTSPQPGDSPDNPLHTETRTADPRPVGEIVSRFRAASMAKPNGNGAVKH